jgi:hypothetical protein
MASFSVLLMVSPAMHGVTRAYGILVVIVAALQLVVVTARMPAGSPPSALEARLLLWFL